MGSVGQMIENHHLFIHCKGLSTNFSPPQTRDPMKNAILLFLLMFALSGIQAQEQDITLRFSASHGCAHAPLDSVLIENLTQGGETTLIYPDTILSIIITNIDIIEGGQNRLQVSQNYPNPFSAKTSIDVYVPDRDMITLSVYDLTGRKVAVHESILDYGLHHFTFHACNQQTYILRVNSPKHLQKQVMIQVGQSGKTSSEIEYNGMTTRPKTQPKNTNADFPYEIGDQLRFTGFVWGDQQEIWDAPVEDTDYHFDIAPYPPGLPSAITGEELVYANQEDLLYGVSEIAGATFNWNLPADWTITDGDYTHTITVTSGVESGYINVYAQNNCGSGPERSLPVNVLFILSLEADPEEGGNTPGAGEYLEDQFIEIAALPETGFVFVNWTGDTQYLNDPEAQYPHIYMPQSDVNLTANFAALHTLALNASPAEGGSVSGGGTFTEGEEVAVSATPNQGYAFVNWTGDTQYLNDPESENTTVTMPDADVSLTANFELLDFQLSLTANPAEAGTVSGEGSYHFGDEVDITAAANEGYAFVNWTGDTQYLDNPYSENATVTMPETDVNLTANFALLDYQLSLTADPIEGGTVSGAGSYHFEDEVDVTATPNEGYAFVNWTGDTQYLDDPGAANATVTMPAADVNLTANFEQLDFQLTLLADPEEGGSVSGEGSYHFGEQVSLSATANTGYTFINWTDEADNVVSTQESFTYTMPAEDKTLTANFEVVEFQLSLSANPANGGTLDGDGTYHYGDEVVVTATPNEGYAFVNWTGDTQYMDDPDSESATLTMPESDVNLTANFELIDYQLSINAEPEEGGSVSGAGTYHFGEVVAVTANPAEGYAFVSWSGDTQYLDDPDAENTTLTMPSEDVTLTASFELLDYQLSLLAEPEEGGSVSGEGTYNFEEEINLTATPNEGYNFVNWTDEEDNILSTEASFVYSMPSADVTLTANFEVIYYQLTLETEPADGGTTEGAGMYVFGETVNISALPNPFYAFTQWDPPAAGSLEDPNAAQTSFTMPSQDVTLTANFEDDPPEDNWFYFLAETTPAQTQYRFVADQAVDLEVDWGNGESDIYNGDVQPAHDFGQEGQWLIRVRGQAERIAFYTGWNCPFAPRLKDIFTPVSEGISGITSARDMFRNTTVEAFTSENFFDEASAAVTNMRDMFRNSQFNQNISNWDVSNVTNMNYLFMETPFDQDIGNWDVGNVTSMWGMFANSSFNQDIGQWNVGNVTNMESLFLFNPFFNQDISNWDVSNVENMHLMFRDSPFNQDIGGWDVSNVKYMMGMFYGTPFNQDISGWDVSGALQMRHMFYNASDFNQDISQWDVSNVTTMELMFFGASSFNQDIGNWDVSKVSNMSRMFENSGFNQDISQWDVSNVTNMQQLFRNSPFDQDIGSWDVSNVTNFSGFLNGAQLSAQNYNSLLINWSYQDVNSGLSFHGGNSQYDLGLPADRRQYLQDERNWTITDGGDTGESFAMAHVNLTANPQEGGTLEGAGIFDIGEEIQISATANPFFVFSHWEAPAGVLDNPNASQTTFTVPNEHVTITAHFDEDPAQEVSFNFVIETTADQTQYRFLVEGATDLYVHWEDGIIEKYNGNTQPTHDFETAGQHTIRVKGATERFSFNTASNCPYAPMLQDILTPVSDGITALNSAAHMFRGTTVESFSSTDFFDEASGGITDMGGMFWSSEFNQDISNWDVSNVTTMWRMFSGTPFNQDIGNWETGQVTSMSYMFTDSDFNQDIGSWDVSQVTGMTSMFQGTPFNQDIGSWETGNVTTMRSMFWGSPFDQDIGGWDVSQVTDMFGMLLRYYPYPDFSHDLSAWDVSSVENMGSFLNGGKFTTQNYNSLLMAWSYLDLNENVNFHAGNSQFDLGLPADRRQYIIDTFNWTITDGGDTGENYFSENLILNAEPEEGGTVSSQGQYHEGGIVNIYAVASQGYEFESWTGNTEHVDEPLEPTTTVTMPAGEVNLTANFILAARSCKFLLEEGVIASGIYTILLDEIPTEVYCDMATDGGGWTLVAVSAQGGNEWRWNNRLVFTTDRTIFGSLDDMDLSSQSFGNNYKNTGMHDIELEDVMVRWASDLDSKWASYHDVSNGTQSLSAVIESQPVSACAPNNPGYAKNAGDNFGDLQTGGERGYCGERLYFNLRNTEGSSLNCGIGASNYSTYGPAFNYRLSHGICTDGFTGPYNEPSFTGFGPCSNSQFMQRGVVHTVSAWTDLDLSSEGQRRSMLLFVR